MMDSLPNELFITLFNWLGPSAAICPFVAQRWYVAYKFMHPPTTIANHNRRWSNFTEACVADGHLHLLKWMHEKCLSVYWPMNSQFLAALHGHVNILDYFIETNKELFTEDIITGASSGGHVDILKMYGTGCTEWNINTFLLHAIQHGRINVLEYKKEEIAKFDYSDWEDLVVNAIRFEQIETMKWLVRERNPPFNALRPRIILTRRMEALKWLYENEFISSPFN